MFTSWPYLSFSHSLFFFLYSISNCELVFMDIHSIYIIAKQRESFVVVFFRLISLVFVCRTYPCSPFCCSHTHTSHPLDRPSTIMREKLCYRQTASISIVLELCYHHSFISFISSLLSFFSSSLSRRLIYAISSNHQTLM